MDMSVEELKLVLSAAGVDFSDCVEKPDLVERYEELTAAPPPVEGGGNGGYSGAIPASSTPTSAAPLRASTGPRVNEAAFKQATTTGLTFGTPPKFESDRAYLRGMLASDSLSMLSVDGKYEILRALDGVDKGFFGSILEAREVQSGRPVVVKMFGVSDTNTATEADLFQHFEHPNIIRLLDHTAFRLSPSSVQVVNGLVMERADCSLASYVAAHHHRLSPDFVLRTLLDVAYGLDFLHSGSCSVLHLDLKPENVLMLGGRSLLADFNVSMVAAFPTMRKTPIPASLFAAPELVSGSSPACDIYSFGELARHLLRYIAVPIPQSQELVTSISIWTSAVPHLRGTAKDVIVKLRRFAAHLAVTDEQHAQHLVQMGDSNMALRLEKIIKNGQSPDATLLECGDLFRHLTTMKDKKIGPEKRSAVSEPFLLRLIKSAVKCGRVESALQALHFITVQAGMTIFDDQQAPQHRGHSESRRQQLQTIFRAVEKSAVFTGCDEMLAVLSAIAKHLGVSVVPQPVSLLLCAVCSGNVALFQEMLTSTSTGSVRELLPPSLWDAVIDACVRRDLPAIVRLVADHVRLSCAQLSKAFHTASIFGRVEIMRTLLAAGAELNQANDDGRRPLNTAILSNQVAAVALLLERGADCTSLAPSGDLPMVDAVSYALSEDQIQIIELLLAHKANVNAVDGKGTAPLLAAVYRHWLSAARLLLCHGASLEAPLRGTLGRNTTVLHEAVMRGREDMVRLLVEFGADVDAKFAGFIAPSDLAMFQGHARIAEFLRSQLHSAPLDGTWLDDFDFRELDVEAVQTFLTFGGNHVDLRNAHGSTALHLACAAGRADIVEYLLHAAGSSFHVKDLDGMTPLDIAILSCFDEGEQLLRDTMRGVTHDHRSVPTNYATVKVPLQ